MSGEEQIKRLRLVYIYSNINIIENNLTIEIISIFLFFL